MIANDRERILSGVCQSVCQSNDKMMQAVGHVLDLDTLHYVGGQNPDAAKLDTSLFHHAQSPCHQIKMRVLLHGFILGVPHVKFKSLVRNCRRPSLHLYDGSSITNLYLYIFVIIYWRIGRSGRASSKSWNRKQNTTCNFWDNVIIHIQSWMKFY